MPRIAKKHSKIYKNNASGITGVSWNKKLKKWIAYITINGKTSTLGLFKEKDEAAMARYQAEEKYGFQKK